MRSLGLVLLLLNVARRGLLSGWLLDLLSLPLSNRVLVFMLSLIQWALYLCLLHNLRLLIRIVSFISLGRAVALVGQQVLETRGRLAHALPLDVDRQMSAIVAPLEGSHLDVVSFQPVWDRPSVAQSEV